MKDFHAIFTEFKAEFPEINAKHEDLGKVVHDNGGPLPDKTRWLIKVAISAASNHERALETHISKAREVGVTDGEIKHALLLLIPTAGFPAFMEAYSVFKGLG